MGVAVGTGIHVVYHMACDFPRLIHASSDRFALLEPYFKEQPSYWELVKGVEGVTGILMVVLMVIAFTLATPWLRRGKLTGFNAFWYSHHLFVIVYALLVVHGLYLYLSKEWYQKTVSTHSPTTFALWFELCVWYEPLTTGLLWHGRLGCTWQFLLCFMPWKD